jgi:RNA polymerase sigma factor for flagellar operon FliA
MSYVPQVRMDQGASLCAPQAQGAQSVNSARCGRDDQLRRERLVLEHLPLVRSVARRIHARLRTGFELEDLVNEGVVGLMEAIERYDENRATAFGGFARQRIAGAIFDLLRADDWVPRSVRDRSTLIVRTRERLALALGRAPRRTELAEALGVSEARLERMEQIAQISQVVSLEEPAAGNDLPLREVVGQRSQVQEQLEAREQQERLHGAVDALPERERCAVQGYYLEQRPLRELANAIGVTEARVSQLHRQGVERLRGRLRDEVL